MLEVDFYPVYPSGRKYSDKPKNKGTTPVKAECNRRAAAKKLAAVVNTNFDTGDLLVHLTYLPEKAPQTYEEAHRDISNYTRRIGYWRRKKGLPEGKYVITIEEQIYKTGTRKGRSNWHFHVFLTEMPRDVAEDLWKDGERVNADRFQPERFGQKAAAEYLSKDPRGTKRYICSRNCKKPVVKTSEPKQLSAAKLKNMCETYVGDNAYWERRYPGYRFIEAYPVWNDYNKRWYLYLEMRKIEEPKKKKRK
ncbi:MAG: hypothetical protein E7591_00870 [Ruminococcaceae bacterium]|nr:hypothetical protein [Oscillospiraceae bacterium]